MIKDIIESVVNEMKVFATAGFQNNGGGSYTFAINVEDVQYWHEGARMIFIVGTIYHYGYVTKITNNALTVLVDSDTLIGWTTFMMDINYRHGHPVDVFDQLKRMAESSDYKLRKFPVVALMQDFDENIGEGISETPIQIIIAVRSETRYTAAQRYTYSFEGKRLTKLYERFIKYLRYDRSSHFMPKDHTKIDRLYWGREGALGNEDNKAYDYIDAIELNIELKTFETC